MKNLTKTILAVLAAGLVSGAVFTQQAQADTISIGDAAVAGFIGGYDWTYTGTTSNSYLDATGEVVIHGFAGFIGVHSGPAGWTFVGPVAHSGHTDLDWHYTGATGAVANGTTFAFTAESLYGLKVLGSYNTTDRSSVLPGNPASHADGPTSVPSVPDGGSAVALLGIALAGVEVLRRKLRA